MIETVESPQHTGLSQEASLAPQWFVGIAWGDQNHQVVLLDQQRRRVGARVVPHDGTSLAPVASWLRAVSGGAPSQVAVAIEVPRGAMVETLLAQGVEVLAINPTQLDRFRDRHTVAGAKDDRRDALGLADALRTAPQSCRAVRLGAPARLVWRELSRAEAGVRQELRRTATRLRDQLQRLYPPMLQLCSAADEAWRWDVLALAPTPRHAPRRSEDQVRRLLTAPRLRRFKAPDVLACFQGPALPVAPGAAEAAQAHGGFWLPCLRVLAEHLRACEQHVSTFLRTVAEDNAASDPSDVAMVPSLPGVGRKSTAWLFAKAAQSLAERDSPVLRTQGGRAPVTRQRGQRRQGVRRRGWNRRWRHALYPMARVALPREAHCASVYAALRAKGQRHGQALRNLAARLRRLRMAMLRDRTRYDASRIHGGQKVLTER